MLTDSLAATGKERQSESQALLSSVRQSVNDLFAWSKSAATSLNSNITARSAEAAKSNLWLWGLAAMSAWLGLMSLLLIVALLQRVSLAADLMTATQQLVATRATLQEEQRQLAETRTTLRKLAQLAPVTRFQFVPSAEPTKPFIRINPQSIQEFQGATIALPELTQP